MDKWNWGKDAFRVRSRMQILWKSRRPPAKKIESYTLEKTDITKILEFGCGGGTLGLCFVVKGYDVIFTDYSEQMLQSCRRNIAIVEERDYREKLSCQNMFNMGIKDNSIDLIFSDGVYEHIHTKQERLSVLLEQKRILKKNGCLAIVIPNNRHPLFEYWKKKGYLWFDKNKCPDWEIRLGVDELMEELNAANFKDVYTDGCRVYEAVGKYPLTGPRRLFMNICKLLLPEWGRNFRIKYGTCIYAIGRKQ